MKINHITVVYKKSIYQVYGVERKDKRFLNLVENNHPSVAGLYQGHLVHQASLEKVRETLAKLKIKTKFIYRAKTLSLQGSDIIITVGGDGTFLEASHAVQDKPILGINSNPEKSVGMYCGITASELGNALEEIDAGTAPTDILHRLGIEIDGSSLPLPILNDALICNLNPASSSRYSLYSTDKDQNSDEIVSSGLWISTAAGSTAAIRSAGGQTLALESSAFQYLIRESFQSHLRSHQARDAIVQPPNELIVCSKMRKGYIFIDGAHRKIPFPTGSTARFFNSPHAIMVFYYNHARRQKYYG